MKKLVAVLVISMIFVAIGLSSCAGELNENEMLDIYGNEQQESNSEEDLGEYESDNEYDNAYVADVEEVISQNISYIIFFEDYLLPYDGEREIIRLNEPLPYSHTIRFISGRKLYDFRVHGLGFISNELEFSFYLDSYSLCLPVLLTNQILEFTTRLPCGIPAEAVAFTVNDEQHAYTLGQSGYDGRVVAHRMNE